MNDKSKDRLISIAADLARCGMLDNIQEALLAKRLNRERLLYWTIRAGDSLKALSQRIRAAVDEDEAK